MWPLDAERRRLVGELSQLIARGGAWRFLRGPVVAADTRDYPDAWEESRTGVARALSRTAWHARLDGEVVLADLREPGPGVHARLRKTAIELARADTSRSVFDLVSIGNDDVAGLLATEVGRAYVARLDRTGEPFRTGAAVLPDAATGTIAAVYRGLGVVAPNASQYARAAGEIVARSVIHEHEIDRIGGLPPDDLAFLLAVQATVRDDVLPALDTLARVHAAAVAAWRAALDDHEDELREMLAAGDPDAETPPARPDAPRAVTIDARHDEADLGKHNFGRRVYRYPETSAWATAPLAALAGVGVGFAGILLGAIMPLAIAPVVGFAGGLAYGLRKKQLRCAACGCFLGATDTTCRACGGAIAGDVRNLREGRERLDADSEREEP